MRRVRLPVVVLLALIAVWTAPSLVARAAPVGRSAGARAASVHGTLWQLRSGLQSGTVRTFAYGVASDQKLIGDWNGDGVRTPGVFRAGTVYLRNSNTSGAGEIVFAFGQPGDVAVVGDWNGDGIETTGVFTPATRTWSLRNTNGPTSGSLGFAYGAVNDLPVTGDWNRDGVDTVGVLRQRVWYLRNSNTPGVADRSFAYGTFNDRPIIGDWNGDGYDTVGLVRGTTWLLRNSNTGGNAEISFDFGAAGDVPLVWHTAVTSVPAGLEGTEWNRLPTTERYVALTFDAGANAAGLPSILGTLQDRQVAGTFFLTGRWAEGNPALAAQIARYYPVGNHSYSHPDLTTLSDDAVRTEVTRAQTAILSASRQDARPMFRFPFGARDARTIAIVNSLSYGSVRWTVDTLGWQGTSGGQSVDTIVRRVLDNLTPGEIVLMHVGSNPNDGSTLDADALPRVIDELQARGYGFVTIRAAM
jgi:peptidoglycan/xylan/chitin deacetylase (PgdA/CDA1 family)